MQYIIIYKIYKLSFIYKKEYIICKYIKENLAKNRNVLYHFILNPYSLSFRNVYRED